MVSIQRISRLYLYRSVAISRERGRAEDLPDSFERIVELEIETYIEKH